MSNKKQRLSKAEYIRLELVKHIFQHDKALFAKMIARYKEDGSNPVTDDLVALIIDKEGINE